MALGQNRIRMRSNRSSAVNKKLDFMSSDLVEPSHEEPLEMRLDNCSDTFSPCHTRSGTVYKPKTSNFGDLSHDRSSDSDSDRVPETAKMRIRTNIYTGRAFIKMYEQKILKYQICLSATEAARIKNRRWEGLR